MQAVIDTEKRESVGKKENSKLRREGKIPGIYYMHGEDSIPIAVDEKQLRSVIHSEASIIDLKLSGKKDALKSVIREVQWDPVKGYPLHVDFMGIKMTEKISVDVPVHLVGTAVGVKQNGGVLQHILREISIEALPLDIPEHIDVDITDLDIGDSFRVEELSIENVKIMNEPTQSIAIVRAPVVIEEPEEEELEEGLEPELVGEEKEEQEKEPEDTEAEKKE